MATVGLRLEATDPVIRKRIEFAFRVACRWAGEEPARLTDESPDFRVLDYGRAIPALYRPLPADFTPLPFQGTLLAHGLDAEGRVDWLGELFSWIGGEWEQGQPLDPLGRRTFADSRQARCGADPLVPMATHAASQLLGLPPGLTLCMTHDVDFLPVSARDVLRRGLKNAANLARFGDVPGALEVGLKSVLALAGFPAFPPLDRWATPHSSFYFLMDRSHPKDGNYGPEDALELVALLRALGAEVGIHGSWTSLERPGGLAEEYEALPGARGGRQHYLRYDGGPHLFRELARAGAVYDCSAGWCDRAGFRHGASFPFPVWDLERDEPTGIVEIPLVLMDVALSREWRLPDRGAFSVLWHDTVLARMQHPRWAVQAYRELKARPGVTWKRADQVAADYRI